MYITKLSSCVQWFRPGENTTMLKIECYKLLDLTFYRSYKVECQGVRLIS